MIKAKTLQKNADGSYNCKGGIMLGQTADYNRSFSLPLHLISQAWYAGLDLDDLADGFGLGVGTLGDWSSIRDSSEEKQLLMLERALNYLEQCAMLAGPKANPLING